MAWYDKVYSYATSYNIPDRCKIWQTIRRCKLLNIRCDMTLMQTRLRRICRHRIYRGYMSDYWKYISAVYISESSRDVVVACDWLEAIGDVIDDVVHRRRLCWLLGALNYWIEINLMHCIQVTSFNLIYAVNCSFGALSIHPSLILLQFIDFYFGITRIIMKFVQIVAYDK